MNIGSVRKGTVHGDGKFHLVLPGGQEVFGIIENYGYTAGGPQVAFAGVNMNGFI